MVGPTNRNEAIATVEGGIDEDNDATLTELSAGQARLWFYERVTPGTALYNICFGLSVDGALDLRRLRACLSVLVGRHEVLRTTFPEVAVYPEQLPTARALVGSVRAVPLEVLDLTTAPQQSEQRELAASEHRTRPFDVERGALWRCLVIELTEERHEMLFTMHHMLTDARSKEQFIHELARLYSAGPETTLAPLRLSSSEFAKYQRRRRRDEAHELSLRWWRDRLVALPRLDLPISRTVRMPRHVGDAIRIELSAETTARLRAFSRLAECSLFVTLLAVWAVVLHRYSRQSDFAIGAPVVERGQGDFDDVLGFFINLLVLRCDLSDDPSFTALVSRLKSALSDARAHQEVEFGEIVQMGRGSWDLDLNPLVQAGFNFCRAPSEPSAEGIHWRWLPPERGDRGAEGTAKFNLGLALLQSGDRIFGTLEFATDLFDREAIERMANHLLVVLEHAVMAPDRPVGAIPLLTDDERKQMLVAWNDTARPHERTCVHDWFRRCAEAEPERTAVVCDGKIASYGDLERRANRLAHHLAARGARSGVLVGLCLDRSMEMIVALLAILKTGAAYVPLDPAYPPARLAFMMKDSGASLLVTTAARTNELGDYDGVVVRLDADEAAITEGDARPPPTISRPNDIAYVIYTSGSTGLPKGVGIEHGSLSNLIAHFAEELAIEPRDALLAVTSLSFDIAMLEIFLPLTHGATLRLATRDDARDADKLVRDVEHATIMQATPATWLLMFEAGWAGKSDLRALCGGEALSRDLATKLASRTGAAWNCYGPTETTIWSSTWRIDLNRGAVSLGRGIANTELYVLDANRQPTPVGVPGELFIGGAGVARGYLGRDALTAERFVPNHLAPGTSGRLYRTGDLVRWSADGLLEYLERLDLQVKLRGFRIELGEIEAALTTHPAIARCAVVVSAGQSTIPTGGDELVAYYVGASGHDVGADELKRHLRTTLPEHMIPSALVKLTELPRTANGKTDRRTLTTMAVPVSVTPPTTTPRDHTERLLADVWKDVLGISSVDVRSTFFEQGGSSLKLLRVQHGIRSTLGIQLHAADLFRHATIEALAEHLSSRNERTEAAAQKSAVRTTVQPAQETGPPSLLEKIGRRVDAMSTSDLELELQKSIEAVLKTGTP